MFVQECPLIKLYSTIRLTVSLSSLILNKQNGNLYVPKLYFYQFECTVPYCNSISRVNPLWGGFCFFFTNMTLSVKGDFGTDRQPWFQASSI